ncbi:serine/threonine protein kinase, variant 1 [Aphanomyces astaci]|uniref:mitogen-activated protein kinase kinase n=1 Tax=Aphanomyces astaci TaxID=112090 RepID=W4GYF3_APHAT|nr:serine/threonine protein kinase, variant 1 [Aphanomyces astaci]ETV84687.1 serine/threonine protein kinase, variant 1 [Aphanomyces astaci]|eukprot:XP_009826379.1 serine/threonine protein kinase, variant 1 [Aphanomyces astaci]
MDYRKRNRFESMNDDSYSKTAEGGQVAIAAAPSRRKQQRRQLQRAMSLPNIQLQMERKPDPPSIFPDVDVRSLRLAEVRSWVCPSVKSPPPSTTEPQVLATTPPIPPPTENLHLLEKHLDDAIEAMRIELSLDTGVMSKDGREVAPSNLLLPSHTAAANPVSTLGTSSSSLRKEGSVGGNGLTIMSSSTPTSSSVATASPHTPSPLPQAPASTPKKRFSLRLQLDDMPTPQQAENRANRAANRLLASRDAMDPTDTGPVSGMQKAMLAFRLSNHSGSDNDPSSPHDGGELGRFSNGSSYSPNHGRFTTQNVLVSEAGIASPDSSCLHLQENVVQVREVGRGASGVVYKAVHLPTLKVVAIKEIPVYGKSQRRQMVRELHALYANLVPLDDKNNRSSTAIRLPSPYIVSFYDAYVDKQKNCISLVMEYMGVGSLQDVVLKCGGIAEPLVARIAASVLRGLQHIHGNRMVHRDIKPHNLLLNHQGDIKISDFGLARTLNDNATQTKTFVGTLLYMAPERIGGGDYAYPSDIWSFGLVLVSVALGRYPLPTHDGFFGLVDSVANEGYLKLPPVFSDACRDFMDKCLAIEPEDRWTAEQLLRHPFLVQNPPETTLKLWKQFVDTICEPRRTELEDISDAVYSHIYQNIQNYTTTTTPQSDYGMSMLSDTPRHIMSVPPVERSLQLGLSKYLDLPASVVYDKFEEVRVGVTVSHI